MNRMASVPRERKFQILFQSHVGSQALSLQRNSAILEKDERTRRSYNDRAGLTAVVPLGASSLCDRLQRKRSERLDSIGTKLIVALLADKISRRVVQNEMDVETFRIIGRRPFVFVVVVAMETRLFGLNRIPLEIVVIRFILLGFLLDWLLFAESNPHTQDVGVKSAESAVHALHVEKTCVWYGNVAGKRTLRAVVSVVTRLGAVVFFVVVAATSLHFSWGQLHFFS